MRAKLLGPSSPNKTQIEMDVTVSTKPEELTFDTKGTLDGTRGIDIRNVIFNYFHTQEPVELVPNFIITLVKSIKNHVL